MAEKLVTIRTFDSYIEANIAKGLLESNGIPAFVAGENAANIYTVPSIAAASLQVPEDRVDEATELLEAAQQGVEGEELEEMEEEGSWGEEEWGEEGGDGEGDDEEDEEW